MFEIIWSGAWPCFCSGEWTIKKNGEDVSYAIPDAQKRTHMNTYGSYRAWHFDAHWNEHWTTYEDGLTLKEWYSANRHWVDTICDEWDEVFELYIAIQARDWRYGQCGGCI